MGVEVPPELLQFDVERHSPCWPVERAHVCCEAAKPARSVRVVMVWRSIVFVLLVVAVGLTLLFQWLLFGLYIRISVYGVHNRRTSIYRSNVLVPAESFHLPQLAH